MTTLCTWNELDRKIKKESNPGIDYSLKRSYFAEFMEKIGETFGGVI